MEANGVVQLFDMTLRPTDPRPVELGCGVHLPIRWSRLCVLYRYERAECTSQYVGDKTFEMPSVGQTTSGVWEFHGKRGSVVVDPLAVVAGSPGLDFGCKHDTSIPSSAFIACLQVGALDPDEPMFNAQVINRLQLPDLSRCLSLETDDEFDSFIFEVFGHVSKASLDGRRSLRRTSMRIQRAKRFIEQYAFEDISLGDIAASINVSPFTCLRQFRTATGETPHEYLSRLRLARAQQLLRDRRLAIGEVASRIGIRDRSYFTRWFSRQVGMTPGRFRDR